MILDLLREICPDAEIGEIEAGVSFRDQFEFDSIDFLNLVLATEKILSLRIPEIDYPRLSSLDGCIGYLVPKVAEAREAERRMA
ncbi:MAG: acyl carrier protein [Rhodospirillaceae bacterium]|nr:acyl carrier protein [Rhodospirillaceae bacterium]